MQQHQCSRTLIGSVLLGLLLGFAKKKIFLGTSTVKWEESGAVGGREREEGKVEEGKKKKTNRA